MFEQSLNFFPTAKVINRIQESRISSIITQPMKISAPNEEHLKRHWQPLKTAKESPAFLGSMFEANDAFKDVGALITFLQEAAGELIPQNEHDRRHIFTISFPYTIGRTAVVELSENEAVIKAVRDQGNAGETEVNTVKRSELPETNLLTFDVKPVFPKRGAKGEEIKFQISSAFPGEPAPRLITKARIENHSKKPKLDPQFDSDKAYWDTHAFVTLQ